MKVKRLVLGVFKVNCYILTLDDTNIIIDPGADFNTIEQYFKLENISPDFIINTHGHYDHIGAIADITGRYKIPFYIHRLEEPIISNPEKNLSSFFGKNALSFKTYNLIDKSNVRSFNDLGIEIIHTPGHTPGSIVIKYNNFLFTGDLIFKGGIGRTDLPGGEIKKIKHSLKMLKNMDRELIIYPGHGEESILGYEIETNYYLRSEFLGD